MTYGLDTSVVLRILTGVPAPLAASVVERIERLCDEGNDFFVSDIAVCEAYHAMQHFYGNTKEEAILALQALSREPGFAFSAEAMDALGVPEAWKASPGFVDRMLAAEYASRGYVTLSCEKSFRKLELAEVIRE